MLVVVFKVYLDNKIYDFDGIQLKTKINFSRKFNPSDEITDLIIYLSEAEEFMEHKDMKGFEFLQKEVDL